jgi:aspartate/methionine/tyrosine aminotransferase
MAERTVTLYTFSKKFAMTGWRLGAAVAPPPIVNALRALSGNESGIAHFTQWAGLAALRSAPSDPGGPAALVAALKDRRDAMIESLAGIDGVRVHVPPSSLYVYPEVSGAMARLGITELRAFAAAALRETGVSFCTRQHFGRPLPGERGHYIRLAFSGVGVPEIREGLGRFAAWAAG